MVAARASVPLLTRKIFGCAGVVEFKTPLLVVTNSIESANVEARMFGDVDNLTDELNGIRTH
jgi:hypothetical protein